MTDSVRLPPTYLAGQAGALQREMKYYLTVAKVPLVNNEKDAQLVMDLIGEDVQRRVLSVGADGRVQEYEVHYAATYAVRRPDGKAIISRETLGQERDYTFSQSEVLAKDTEQDRLVNDMRRAVIRQIVRRLQAALSKAP